MSKYVILSIYISCFLSSSFSDTYVNGYVRKDGTYVAPHYRSDKDGDFYNNWSTKGNVNPYTGKEGYKNQPDSLYNYQGQSLNERLNHPVDYYETSRKILNDNKYKSDTNSSRIICSNMTEKVDKEDQNENTDQIIINTEPSEYFTAACYDVIDGDTIKVKRNGKNITIRLSGIDCPEKGQPYFDDAFQLSISLVKNRVVTIGVKGEDRYGRIIGDVSTRSAMVCTDETRVYPLISINDILVIQGLAWWYKQYALNDSNKKLFQDGAVRSKLGLWHQENPIPPWEYRKNKNNIQSKKLYFEGRITRNRYIHNSLMCPALVGATISQNILPTCENKSDYIWVHVYSECELLEQRKNYSYMENCPTCSTMTEQEMLDNCKTILILVQDINGIEYNLVEQKIPLLPYTDIKMKFIKK